jgi:hypothetical protein
LKQENQLRAAGVALSQLQRPFDGLGPRVGEVHRVEPGGQSLMQGLGQLRGHGLHQLAVHHQVQVLVELGLDGGQHPRVAVPHVAHPDA